MTRLTLEMANGTVRAYLMGLGSLGRTLFMDMQRSRENRHC